MEQIEKHHVESAYKKFKSYVFYSKNLIHLKTRIIEFENGTMEETFSELTNAVNYKDILYFNKLFSKITFVPQIKKIKSNESKMRNNIVSNKNVNEEIVIEKINFFIDMPIELLIIDTLWTLLMGKKNHMEKYDYKYVKANIFDSYLFSKSEGLSGIDFDSLKLYIRYYDNYIRWKKDAINKVSQLYNSNNNSMIISLDLKGYFYSANINFDEYIQKSYFNNFDFSFITQLISHIYLEYSKCIHKYLEPNYRFNNLIPIGLVSSGLIANNYLYEFDHKIGSISNVVYYSRYVDDMLIVVPKIIELSSPEKILKELFSDLFEYNDDYINLKDDKRLIIQNDKVKVISIYANGPKSLLEVLSKDLPESSDANLMPNIEYSELDSFFSDIYIKKTDSIKIRDVTNLELSKSKLMRFMSSYLTTIKNTVPSTNNRRKTKYESLNKDMVKQLKFFFDKYNLLSLWDRWEKIFEFSYLSNKTFSFTSNIIKNIKDTINLIQLSDTYLDKKNELLIKLKISLRNCYEYSLASVFAIKQYNIANKFVDIQNKSMLIRKANMINNNLVGFPLLNYLIDSDKKFNDLYNVEGISLSEYSISNNCFDINKFNYSPRFIHFNEFMLCENLLNISLLNSNEFYNNIIDEYKKYFNNDLNFYSTIPTINDNVYTTIKVKMNYNYKKESEVVSIAMANVNLYKHNMTSNSIINLTNQKLLINKIDLLRLLNQCSSINYKDNKQNNYRVDFLLFPELFIPYEWLNDLMFFSKKTGIGIITGVKYYVNQDKLINSIANIIPFKDDNRYSYSSIFLREKNDYSPTERMMITSSGYADPIKNKSLYYIFNINNIKYSIFNCYELTDIKARSLMKSNIDIIFSTQYNKDVKYFSNIIEATSRDVGCFVVQVNSSNYGDTRIVGPYKDEYSTIASISGGEKNTIHFGNIDIKAYKEYRNHEKSKEYLSDICKQYNNKEKHLKDDYYKFKKSSAKL